MYSSLKIFYFRFLFLGEDFIPLKDPQELAAIAEAPGGNLILALADDVAQRKTSALEALGPDGENLFQNETTILSGFIGEFALSDANETAIEDFIEGLAPEKLFLLETLVEGVILSAANTADQIVFDSALKDRDSFLEILFALVTRVTSSSLNENTDEDLLKTKSRLIDLVVEAAASDGDPALNYKEALLAALVALFDNEILASDEDIDVMLVEKKSLFSAVLERVGGGLLGE